MYYQSITYFQLWIVDINKLEESHLIGTVFKHPISRQKLIFLFLSSFIRILRLALQKKPPITSRMKKSKKDQRKQTKNRTFKETLCTQNIEVPAETRTTCHPWKFWIFVSRDISVFKLYQHEEIKKMGNVIKGVNLFNIFESTRNFDFKVWYC